MAFCSSCGTENKTGSFCSSCGTPLANQTVDQATVGSSKAMWVHLAPLLLAVIGTFLAPLVTGLASSTGASDYGFGLGLFSFVPLTILWVPALIVRLAPSSTDFERRHASASLNYQISLFIYISVIFLLAIFGTISSFSTPSLNSISNAWGVWALAIIALGVLGILSLVFNIAGSSAGSAGKEYRYPIAIKFLK
jgi:uncharacterized Tic20 family protein